METVRIGLAGFGTVGSGLARVLQENGDWIERRIGKRLAIKTVLVRDPAKQRAAQPGPGAAFCTNPSALVDDPEIPVIVELMGGIEAAKSLIERALADNEGDIQLCARDNNVLIKSERATIYTRLVEGRYPKWRDVFPREEGTLKIELCVGPFHSAVRQAAIVTRRSAASCMATE